MSIYCAQTRTDNHPTDSSAPQITIIMPSKTFQRRETFRLGDHELPRLFNGLWQLSSNAWGSAPTSKIKKSMEVHAQHGYTAFGKPHFSYPFLPCASSI